MGVCKGPTCGRTIRFVRLLPNLEGHPIEVEPTADGTIGIVKPAADGRMAVAADSARPAGKAGPNPFTAPTLRAAPTQLGLGDRHE